MKHFDVLAELNSAEILLWHLQLLYIYILGGTDPNSYKPTMGRGNI